MPGRRRRIADEGAAVAHAEIRSHSRVDRLSGLSGDAAAKLATDLKRFVNDHLAAIWRLQSCTRGNSCMRIARCYRRLEPPRSTGFHSPRCEP